MGLSGMGAVFLLEAMKKYPGNENFEVQLHFQSPGSDQVIFAVV
jgi:hypothetical protein